MCNVNYLNVGTYVNYLKNIKGGCHLFEYQHHVANACERYFEDFTFAACCQNLRAGNGSLLARVESGMVNYFQILQVGKIRFVFMLYIICIKRNLYWKSMEIDEVLIIWRLWSQKHRVPLHVIPLGQLAAGFFVKHNSWILPTWLQCVIFVGPDSLVVASTQKCCIPQHLTEDWHTSPALQGWHLYSQCVQ